MVGQPGPGGGNTPPPSVHERLKTLLSPQSAQQDEPATDQAADDTSQSSESTEETASPRVADPKAPQKPVDAQASEEADVPDDDAQSEETQLSTLKDLAEATGLDLDKILDLEVPTKIDGKDGKARLRDLQKSYQLDGHINQKLATLDNDRKAFHAEREKYTRETGDKLKKLDAGVKTLERALMGEFSTVDWEKLQTDDPLTFNAQWVAYQQKYAVMQSIAAQINAERQQAEAEQQAQYKAYVEEQRKLFTAKVPEWSEATSRKKAQGELAELLQEAYGFSKEEAPQAIEQIVDHRHALILRDAQKWHQLQKSKPTALNKVKAAPKLLKPGTPQSRTAQSQIALQNDRAKLKQTGRARDAAPVLKRLLFK